MKLKDYMGMSEENKEQCVLIKQKDLNELKSKAEANGPIVIELRASYDGRYSHPAISNIKLDKPLQIKNKNYGRKLL